MIKVLHFARIEEAFASVDDVRNAGFLESIRELGDDFGIANQHGDVFEGEDRSLTVAALNEVLNSPRDRAAFTAQSFVRIGSQHFDQLYSDRSRMREHAFRREAPRFDPFT